MELKNAEFELKREPDEDGRFEGYASVFNVVDQGLDSVAPGAFTKSLGQRMPKMLWQHDKQKVIGKWEEVKEDERGLFVRGRLFKDVTLGREAMTLLREGVIDSMSIGYKTVEAMPEAGGRVRKLVELDLFEVSLVTFPMLPSAMVTAVKADDITTEREFEKFLRDAGFPKEAAKRLALNGFKGLDRQRDAEDEAQTEAMQSLISQLTRLKEIING